MGRQDGGVPRDGKPQNKTVQAKLKTVKGSFDLRGDIWEVGGYNVASADQGSFEPHCVLVENSFMTQFIKCVTDLDQVASRPVIVAINTDSMFNCVDSITSRIAVEMTEGLKGQGVMVTTDQRMWKSMYSQFGSQFSTMRAAKRDTLGKNAIWSVIEKNLFRQRVFLMCATNREHVSTLNEGAYRPKESGVDSEMLTDVTGPTQVFRIASGGMTPDDYAKGDATIYQRGTPSGSTTTRFNKDKRYKAQWIEPMVGIYELEPEASFSCYWFPVYPDSVDFLCEQCRAAKTMDAIEIAQHRPTTCINCSANTQDHYRKSAPVYAGRTKISACVGGPSESRFQELRPGQTRHQQRVPKVVGVCSCVCDQQCTAQIWRGTHEVIVPYGWSSDSSQSGQRDLQERPRKAIQRLQGKNP